MRAIKKYPVRRLTRVLRDAYRLEPMEPRVLLSADPVLGAAQAILIPNIDHDQALLGAYDLDDAHQYHDLVTPALVQQIRADQAQASASLSALKGAVPASFAVDAVAFDMAQLGRAGFMDSSLTVAANEVLKGSGSLNASEAASLYARQRRRLDLEPLQPNERQLIAALNLTIPEADVPA